MGRLRLATVWLGGCSGCHMSFLDLDEFLIDLAGKVDIVFSPFIDVKEYPEGVDVVLVEGAIANEEHLETIRRVRERTRMLISFGDCAVTGNVTALRNPLGGAEPVLRRVYLENGDLDARIPAASGIVPALARPGDAGPCRRPGGRLPAGLSPARPRRFAPCSNNCSRERRPQLEGREIRFG